MKKQSPGLLRRSHLLAMLAWLPGISSTMFWMVVLPHLWASNQKYGVGVQTFTLYAESHAIAIHAVLLSLTVCAIFYQTYIRRNWVDSAFRVINIFYALMALIGLLFFVLNIDPMPRQ